MDSSSQLQEWQEKLRDKLIAQFGQKELQKVTERFFDALAQDNPDLRDNRNANYITSYLVAGQGDRHKQIAQFLTAVQESYTVSRKTEPDIESSIETLLSYLLQILVRKNCEVNDMGLTYIPVNKRQTVELISATRTSVSHLPVFSDGRKEHKNGQRNSFFQNVGHFLPETGEFDEANICNNIAKDLLICLGAEAGSNENPVSLLTDYLSAYVDAPENAPLQALFIEDDLRHNPLHLRSVADKFRQQLDQLLWIYVYGGNQSNDWLHVSETRLEGLVQRYERDKTGLQTSFSQSEKGIKMSQNNKIGNFGDNTQFGDHTTINIVTGTQTDSHTGTEHHQTNQQYAEQLYQQLSVVQAKARKADDISDDQLTEIIQAINEIKTEIQKKQGADSTILSKAKAVLESFKEIKSIGESIVSIIKLLVKLTT